MSLLNTSVKQSETILKKKFLNFSFLFIYSSAQSALQKRVNSQVQSSLFSQSLTDTGALLSKKSGDCAYQESKGAVLEPLHSAQEVLCITSCRQGLSPVGRILFCLLQLCLSCSPRGCTKEPAT